MAKDAMKKVMTHLRQVMLVHEQASDGELLRRFIDNHDQLAFEALVRRHGKMVLGVCRRVLRNPEDAEDAFQSVFLVLVRKARAIVPREMVGNWLYGVARQTAIRVKSMNAKRARREIRMAVLPEPEPGQERRNDVSEILDQELSRLSDKYRAVVVLSDLEGKTRKEVARQLGWPEGSVSGRLARARALLAKRLVKRGLVLSGEAVAVLLSQNAASAFMPPGLVTATVQAAFVRAAGQTAAISAKIGAITQGVLTSMLLTKLKTLAVVSCLGLFGIGLGTWFLAGLTPAGAQGKIERKSGGEAKTPTADKGKASEEKASLAEVRRSLDNLEVRVQASLEKLAEKTQKLAMEVGSLRKDVEARSRAPAKASPPTKEQLMKQILVFTFKNHQAEEVAPILDQLFGRELVVGPTGVQVEQKVRIATFPSSNTIIVRGDPNYFDVIEAVVTKLETIPRQTPREKEAKPNPAAK